MQPEIRFRETERGILSWILSCISWNSKWIDSYPADPAMRFVEGWRGDGFVEVQGGTSTVGIFHGVMLKYLFVGTGSEWTRTMSDNEAPLNNVDREVLDWTLENHPHPILITAGEGHEEHERNDILYVNRAFEEMTGYSKEEVTGKKPKILQGEKTHKHIEDYMSETLAAEEHFIGETVNYRKSGEEYAVRLSIDPIEQDGEITHWVSIQQEMSNDPLTQGFLRG